MLVETEGKMKMHFVKNRKAAYEVLMWASLIAGTVIVIAGSRFGMFLFGASFHYGLQAAVEGFRKE